MTIRPISLPREIRSRNIAAPAFSNMPPYQSAAFSIQDDHAMR
jgi:hypothetical protein